MRTEVTKLHPAVAGSKRLTAETMWRVPRVGAPVPAPGGRTAAVPVVTFDLATNRSRGRLWLVPADGSPPRPLTSAEHDSREPSWSPDGRRVAFLRKGPEKDAKQQVHVLPVDGGEPEKLTDLPLGAFDPRWTPDGTALVFGAKLLRGHGTIDATRAELARRKDALPRPFVTEERVFRYWDEWLVDGEIVHLFRLDLATGELRDLVPGTSLWFDWNGLAGNFDIAPDGSSVAFSAIWFDEARQLLRTGVHVVPMAGGAPRLLTAEHPDSDFRPRWAPSGGRLLYGMQEDPFFYADRVRLQTWDGAGDRHERVLDWELSPSHWEFDRKGTLWFEAEKDARSSLFRWDGAAPPVEVVRGGTVGGVAPADDGAVWFTLGTISSPAEVHRLAPGAKAPVRVTRFTAEALAGVALGEVREVRYEGAAGEAVQMFVVFPPGHDPDAAGAAPQTMVHVIHGGPHGISGDTFHPRWNAQIFASWGHVVAMVNFQGSTSWGQDFAQRIQGSWGDRPFGDVMRGTDALVALGWADPSRMAATGASYGGYLVAWIAGHTDRFRCLVNHAGVFDSWNQYASDVTQGRARSFGGEPWERMEVLDHWSPARAAKAFVTPMLVSHGERDYRVPVGQGLECYSILKAKGVAARLVHFPDENHWVLKPSNSLVWYAEVEAWLRRWLAR
jgi:dipeptidyl aminopeptidase/acylaminoacyl peptidase